MDKKKGSRSAKPLSKEPETGQLGQSAKNQDQHHQQQQQQQQKRHLGGAASSHRKWQKVVYGGMQAGFEENHTDTTFLDASGFRADSLSQGKKTMDKKKSKTRAEALSKEPETAQLGQTTKNEDRHHHQQQQEPQTRVAGSHFKWQKVVHGGKQLGFEENHTDSTFSEDLGKGVSSHIKWQKMVYGGMQPGFEDNHTDSTFLEAMVMNANVVKRDTWTAVRDSVAISQYVCVVAMVASVWTYSLKGVLDASLLLILDTVLLLLGFVVLLFTTESISLGILYRYAMYFTYFVSGLYVLAPVFQTLTSSISSDSIWALTICLLMVHLFFHDYIDASSRPPPTFTTSQGSKSNDMSKKLSMKKPATLSGNVSLNASIVASVLVASRLPSGLLVFALMLFSSEFFLLFPLVTRCIKQYSVKMHLWSSCILIAVTMGLIYPLNRLAFVLFIAVVVFIMLVCPYWLIRIQEYKFEINGPWDEAKLCFDLD